MSGMAGRIERVRKELQSALEERAPNKDWSFVTRQIGMFSFTGLTPAQVRLDWPCVYACSRTECITCMLGEWAWLSHSLIPIFKLKA